MSEYPNAGKVLNKYMIEKFLLTYSSANFEQEFTGQSL